MYGVCQNAFFDVRDEFVSVSCKFIEVFFFRQKTAYELRISDWSSDVCASDLRDHGRSRHHRVADSGTGSGGVGSAAIFVIGPGAGTASRAVAGARSEERRVGKECVIPCSYRWSLYH